MQWSSIRIKAFIQVFPNEKVWFTKKRLGLSRLGRQTSSAIAALSGTDNFSHSYNVRAKMDAARMLIEEVRPLALSWLLSATLTHGRASEGVVVASSDTLHVHHALRHHHYHGHVTDEGAHVARHPEITSKSIGVPATVPMLAQFQAYKRNQTKSNIFGFAHASATKQTVTALLGLQHGPHITDVASVGHQVCIALSNRLEHPRYSLP
eukprot:4780878-Amphidinium_carterae.1